MSRVRAPKGLVLSSLLMLTLSAAPSVAAATTAQSAQQRDVFLRRSYDLMVKGRFKDAIANQISAIRADRDCVTARRYLAYSLIQTGSFAEAVDQLSTIVLMTKPTALDMYLFGAASLQASQFDQAEKWFKEALQMDPQMVSAKNALQRTAMARQQQDEALKIASAAAAEPEILPEVAELNNQPATATPAPVTPVATPQVAQRPVAAGNNQVTNPWANFGGLKQKPAEKK